MFISHIAFNSLTYKIHFRQVATLLKSGGGGGSDADLEEAWNNIGDFYAERHRWDEAVTHYEKARNVEKLVKCYYALEDYSSLEGIVDLVQPGDPILNRLGEFNCDFLLGGFDQERLFLYHGCIFSR